MCARARSRFYVLLRAGAVVCLYMSGVLWVCCVFVSYALPSPAPFYRRPWVIAVFVMLVVLALVAIGIVVWRVRSKRRYDAVRDYQSELAPHERSSMLPSSGK